MKPRIPERFLPCLLAAALLTAAAPTHAATLFSDDFGPKSLDTWTPSPLGLASHWSGAAGTAAWDGAGHTQLSAGSAQWTDYTFSARVRLQVEQNYPGGLRGRVDPATGAGYAAWLYPTEGVVKLFRATAWHIDSSGLTLLAQAPVGPISVNVSHTLALTFQGSQISVAFNGTPVLQATDTTLTAGLVALDVSSKPIEFDDVEVTQGATVLLADDFSPRPLRRWTSSPLGLAGNWDASIGVAAYNGGGHTQIWACDSQWTDYQVETRFRVTHPSDYPGGLRGRLDTTTGGSYAAWVYPGQGKIKLWRHSVWHIDTAPSTMLAEAIVSIPTGVFHTLALTFDGTQISVAFNGTTVLQVNDATYAAGAIALDVSNQPIDFDDVVTSLGGTPPPGGDTDNGPGGPVLVISKSTNPFTRYAGEILLAEGLNHYAIREIGTLTAPVLADYDVAILGAMTLTTDQVTLLADWVQAGGNLIALRPDPQLASLLGSPPRRAPSRKATCWWTPPWLRDRAWSTRPSSSMARPTTTP